MDGIAVPYRFWFFVGMIFNFSFFSRRSRNFFQPNCLPDSKIFEKIYFLWIFGNYYRILVSRIILNKRDG